MKNKIAAFFIIAVLLLSLCACGKDAKEEQVSREEEKLEEVQSVTEKEPEEEGTYYYDNMYFTLDLPAEWEDQVEIKEERSGEYYRVYFSDKSDQTVIFGIDLSVREVDYEGYSDEYFGALTTDNDQGHLNIRILYPQGLEDSKRSEIKQVLETMEASGEYSINRNNTGVTETE